MILSFLINNWAVILSIIISTVALYYSRKSFRNSNRQFLFEKRLSIFLIFKEIVSIDFSGAKDFDKSLEIYDAAKSELAASLRPFLYDEFKTIINQNLLTQKFKIFISGEKMDVQDFETSKRDFYSDIGYIDFVFANNDVIESITEIFENYLVLLDLYKCCLSLTFNPRYENLQQRYLKLSKTLNQLEITQKKMVIILDRTDLQRVENTMRKEIKFSS